MVDGSPSCGFHREPRAHQLRDFMRFRDEPYFGLWWEPRVGKTWAVNNIFRYRCERGDVDALVVLSYPSGVKHVWSDEMAKDWPPEFLTRCKVLVWVSGKMTKGARREEALSLRNHAGPVVVSMNCEALLTKAGFDYLEWLFKKRRVMLVADESSWMAGWSARTQKMLTLGRRHSVVVKAVLDGTPCEEGPVELYHPTQFLSPGLMGYATKEAFRARYVEYEEEEVPETRRELVVCPQCGGSGRDLTGTCMICAGACRVDTEVPTGRVLVQRVTKQRHGPKGVVLSEYNVFKGYRNMEDLDAKLRTFGSRVLRADVSDAPPKLYASRYFELSPLQRRVYDDLRDKYITEVEGSEVRAANVLLRMTRLQMICRNYYPPERTGEACSSCFGEGWVADAECPACDGLGIVVRVSDLRRIDPKINPAIDALVAELKVASGPTVVWCRFRQDVLDVCEATRADGRNFFRYDGGVPEVEREKSYQEFRAGKGDGIAATIGSGLQRGKDLSRARTLIYYSNDFALRSRRQSEDRAEGLGRNFSTDVVDLIAADTCDLQVIEALRAKRSIAELIMGDPHSNWI